MHFYTFQILWECVKLHVSMDGVQFSLFLNFARIIVYIYSFLHVWEVVRWFYNYCPRLTKLVRGLWNGLRTCVCPSVRPWVRVCVRASGLKINEKCYFSVISWPILILFVLSDRAWCGLQNFYTEFWNSLIMQIYANLFKINEKCYFSVISWPILILFALSDRAWCGLQNFYT